MPKVFATLLLAVLALTAQVVTPDKCVYQVGDNPDWARPDFDDRQWSQNQPSASGAFVWTRCRMDLSKLPVSGELHIGLKYDDAVELFIDGKLAGSFGDLKSEFVPLSFEIRPISFSGTGSGSQVLALRQFPNRNYYNITQLVFAVGTTEGLQGWRAMSVLNELWQQWASLLFGGFSMLIGILLLILFVLSGDRSQRAMLWLGVYCVALGLLRGRDFAVIAATHLPYSFLYCWSMLTNAVILFSLPHLFFALANRPLPRFCSWLAVAGGLIQPAMGILNQLSILEWLNFSGQFYFGVIVRTLMVAVTLTALLAFWPLWQVPRPLRQARNLSLILMLGLVIRQFTQAQGLDQTQWAVLGANAFAALNLSVLIAFFVEIAQRHRKVSADRAELKGEMKSAQEVQRLLTSSTPDVAPWAGVEVAYLPAKEVGGDFYFCRQCVDGQLVVVGDVSGKGLRAAMLASVALGAIRHSKTSAPGTVLQDLNRTLHGQTGGGFITCCAVLMGRDGQLTVANAGHPSPYVDGRELPLEAGLPLGIVPDATYEETSGKADSITIVSDGVVEAENSNRELFGFDRTGEISSQPAAAIAAAAQAWGQNDDITVVTIRRTS